MIDWAGLVGAPVNSIFGQPALYIPNDGEPYNVTVVFDEAYRDVVILEGLPGQNDARPVAGITDAQLQAPIVKDFDQLQVTGGNTYIIKDYDRDSHGITRLDLALTQPYTP